MGWLALGMKSHWTQVRGSSPPVDSGAVRLRLLGATGLLLSLAACLIADHPSIAFLVWVMTMSASALSVAFTLSYAPRALYRLTTVVGRTRYPA